MAKTLTNPVSIEKFAAYLDGNLSLEDTQDMAELIMNDSSLSDILSVNTIIDNQIHQMTEDGFELPNDLTTSDFAFPQLDDLPRILNFDDSGTIIAHEDNSMGINDGCDDSNNEDHFFNQDFVNFNENNNFEGFSSNDNDSMNGSDSHLDFLNND